MRDGVWSEENVTEVTAQHTPSRQGARARLPRFISAQKHDLRGHEGVSPSLGVVALRIGADPTLAGGDERCRCVGVALAVPAGELVQTRLGLVPVQSFDLLFGEGGLDGFGCHGGSLLEGSCDGFNPVTLCVRIGHIYYTIFVKK